VRKVMGLDPVQMQLFAGDVSARGAVGGDGAADGGSGDREVLDAIDGAAPGARPSEEGR
jgi:hypothetical protein